MTSEETLKDLQTIPGVGPNLSRDLLSIGIHSVSELERRNPQQLYDNLMELKGTHVDRCVLYVFRCAVYFATEDAHEPELLKWWKWKDKEYPA